MAFQAARCAANNTELVFLPTNASWLNWIEAEFAALRYFTLNGSDHRTHAEQANAIAGYVRWRNREAKPKTNFAINSKIRSPDYQARFCAEALVVGWGSTSGSATGRSG